MLFFKLFDNCDYVSFCPFNQRRDWHHSHAKHNQRADVADGEWTRHPQDLVRVDICGLESARFSSGVGERFHQRPAQVFHKTGDTFPHE